MADRNYIGLRFSHWCCSLILFSIHGLAPSKCTRWNFPVFFSWLTWRFSKKQKNKTSVLSLFISLHRSWMILSVLTRCISNIQFYYWDGFASFPDPSMYTWYPSWFNACANSLMFITALVDVSLSMLWSMDQKMVSLLSHLGGLWIVSRGMVIMRLRKL